MGWEHPNWLLSFWVKHLSLNIVVVRYSLGCNPVLLGFIAQNVQHWPSGALACSLHAFDIHFRDFLVLCNRDARLVCCPVPVTLETEPVFRPSAQTLRAMLLRGLARHGGGVCCLAFSF